MASTLIIYASTHGHTGTIAERLGSALTESGLSVEEHEVRKGDTLDPSGFDSVIVLASIHANRHQSKMAKWASANSAALNRLPTAFLSVSLSAAASVPEVLDHNRDLAKAFVEAAGWQPQEIEIVAGCLQYPAYNFIDRFLMKRVAKRQKLPLDTSREHEYTDWNALLAFARKFAGRVRSGSGA